MSEVQLLLLVSGVAVHPSVCNFLLSAVPCNVHFSVTAVYIYKYIYPCHLKKIFHVSSRDLCFSSIITFCRFCFRVAFVMKKHLNTHLLGKHGVGTPKKR